MKCQISQQQAIATFLYSINQTQPKTGMINHEYKPKINGNKVAAACILIGLLVYLSIEIYINQK